MPMYFGMQPPVEQTTSSTTTTATSWKTESTSALPMNGTDYEYTDEDADYGATENSTVAEIDTSVAASGEGNATTVGIESTTSVPIVDISSMGIATVAATTVGSNLIRVRRKKTTPMTTVVIPTTSNPGVVWIKVKKRKTTVAPAMIP